MRRRCWRQSSKRRRRIEHRVVDRVGGGVFGNADEWIDEAIMRAIEIVEHAGLDIRLVGHGRVHRRIRAIAERFDG